MGCLCFLFFISRIIGFAVSSIIIPKQLQQVNLTGIMESTLKLISILPRLDLFAKSKWLIYQTVDLKFFI